jgi:hypothetical protein
MHCSAEVYAFLGGVAKDHSALATAATLQQKALQQKPTAAGYALSLAHCLEAQAQYGSAFSVIKKFLQENSQSRVGKRRRTATNAAVLAGESSVLSVHMQQYVYAVCADVYV